jgi:hypothetical protein
MALGEMAELRPSVLYALLFLGGVLGGVGLIYGLFFDSEKFEGNRYENSYAQFDEAALTSKQKQAITSLQSQGIEWAHFRFIEAIKNDNKEQVQAFIDAGMPLNSNSILLEIALSPSTNKESMLTLLNKHYQLNLNALYRLPSYVTLFDKQFVSISGPYIREKEEEYRAAMMEYKRRFVKWEQQLETRKKQMLADCTNDACRSGRINDASLHYADSKPVEPILDYISNERVNVSLLTIFAWQKDQTLISFIQQQGEELIPNKLFLTDAKLIYFTVDANGDSSVVETSQQ